MLLTHIPEMVLSETKGWSEVERSHHPHQWFFRYLVLPLSLLPPALYAWAELMHPGAIFPLSVPARTLGELAVNGTLFFLAEIAMVAYMAMLIQRTARAHDHEPGYDGAYALAALAPVPLWIGSLAMLVPNLPFNLLVMAGAWVASVALIRHGVRPLLHVGHADTAHRIANTVIFSGVLAWIGLMVMMGLLMSVLAVNWAI